jgi:hypothetical protein
MEGLTKAEKFVMLRILGGFLDASRMASNEPRHWPADYGEDNILLDSLAIDVSEEIREMRKKRPEGFEPSQARAHLYFPLDTGTFNALGKSWKKYDEQLRYKAVQKPRKNGNGHME